MAQVDTNIILGGARPNVDISQGLRALAFGQDVAQSEQRNRLTDIALAEKQGLNNAYAAALNPDGTVDQTRLTQGLAASGQGSAIPGAQRNIAEANRSQIDLKNTERESLFKNVTLTAQLLNGVTDESSYQNALQQAKGLGVPLDGVPQNFNPSWVRETQSKALSAAEFLRQQEQNKLQAQNQANIDRDFAQRQGKIDYDQANPVLNVVETSQGTVGVNPRTLSASPVTVNGQALPGKSVDLNEGQSKDLLFANRMTESNNILNELANKGVYRSSDIQRGAEKVPLIGGALSAAANAIVASPDQQRVDQAKRDFINATLRKESGAAIGQSEFDNAERQYFPQIGDSPEVIAQKAANREQAIAGVSASIPSRYRAQNPEAIRQSTTGGNQSRQAEKTIRRRGKLPDGRSVVEYTDGTQEVLR